MKWLTPGAAIAAMFTGATFAHADTNYEYESSEGYHAEEWYDAADWFNGKQRGSDQKAADYERDMSGLWDFWAEDGLWEDDYDYDYSSNGSRDYGYHYTWNDSSKSWQREYGYHESDYDYDPASYMIDQRASSSSSVDSAESNRSSISEFQNRNVNERRSNLNTYSRSVDSQRNHQDLKNQSKQLKQRTLNGVIDGFRHMRLEAQNDQGRDYTVTKVKLDNGKSIVVNLGEKERLDGLDLERGDEVKVKGVLGKLNGEPIFITNTLKINDRSFDVNRAFDELNVMERQSEQNRFERSSASSQDIASRQNQYRRSATQSSSYMSSNQNISRVEGTVDRFYSTSIDGADEDRTLARLRLENGQTITVDLGESRTVAELDLNSGDRVRIQGDLERIEGQRVLKANRIWINGERATKSYSYNY
ncbi:hypothetical protein QEH52_02485 [Coraliomargarita sp. SDUM461003]|uniref:Uncharacterized protein n=1 Tax=Thalassobacterium maritimum TaxID=3041265 RepID=A0ABU1AQB9_9BACT|nr:hypothetical protein [Coraliomargarita sp. SDUM461003]MDQ8206359.1 hypothetical protein [Coraliomargarita sp. SDUM461003]